ncbi:4-hydroxyphenylpyruvate dioxygenase-like protein [Platysternon megacephalum]|uniref:4-hydroxyphenylpyruvate dioxygenase-like protein n=1 Tax=Platysternon megacephalum TaxID=55544 RepID=A0A4D9DZ67_9SAUR|nr:4-hydroxyphenylpyruvate dioxygenase-like protein [Platysternon megacephalum]
MTLASMPICCFAPPVSMPSATVPLTYSLPPPLSCQVNPRGLQSSPRCLPAWPLESELLPASQHILSDLPRSDRKLSGPGRALRASTSSLRPAAPRSSSTLHPGEPEERAERYYPAFRLGTCPTQGHSQSAAVLGADPESPDPQFCTNTQPAPRGARIRADAVRATGWCICIIHFQLVQLVTQEFSARAANAAFSVGTEGGTAELHRYINPPQPDEIPASVFRRQFFCLGRRQENPLCSSAAIDACDYPDSAEKPPPSPPHYVDVA